MASAVATDISGCVLVPLERLRALEALEAELPTIIEKAKQDRDKERLAALDEKRKLNPEPHRQSVLEHYHKHKEEINAKRRERYRLKKQTEAAAGAGKV